MNTGNLERLNKLSPEEAYRFSLFSRQRWLFLQGIWTQKEIGVLDSRVWGAYERVICSILDDETGDRVEWEYHVDILDPSFVDFVNECSM